MEIKSATFIVSNSDYIKCPAPEKPEYAFIGRSNVGKSSLINMLCAKRGLAKTSSTPGKTLLINHFLVNENWYLVDLPGYGFAKVSKTERDKLENMINGYLKNRSNLLSVFVLIDSRIPPQQIDLNFINGLGKSNIPFSIVFTKADKLSRTKLSASVNTFKLTLLKTWNELPPTFITSAETRMGRDEVMSYIEETNKVFKA
jgi:GTP-binding protein